MTDAAYTPAAKPLSGRANRGCKRTDREVAMRLAKWGHSCIRLEGPGGRIVIDPGSLTEAGATAAVDAILLTHEHADHFLETRVRAAAAANPRLQVWTNASVASLLKI